MEGKKTKVGIVGLGLIGSSILKGLYKKNNYELFVCSFSSYKKALDYTKNSFCDINIVKNCDIVFVCSFASKTIEILNELNKFLDKNTTVVDVSSFKDDLLNKNYNFDFILSHPMAGTEKSGFEAGFEELFHKTKWLVQRDNELLNGIILDLGAKPYLISMENHDNLCAQISHLPAVLSFLLFDSVNNNAKNIASSGFRDMTRLALTPSDLADFMFKNKKNIRHYFDIIVEKFKQLEKMNTVERINYFKKISEKRNKMYDSNGKNIL